MLGRDSTVQLEKLERLRQGLQGKAFRDRYGTAGTEACLEYFRDGDTLLISKLDRLARSTSDLYRIVSELTAKGVSFKVLDDPSIDTTSAPASSSWASLP